LNYLCALNSGTGEYPNKKIMELDMFLSKKTTIRTGNDTNGLCPDENISKVVLEQNGKLNLNKLEKLTPKVIGTIGVDAGIVWIGDPCYILHKEEKTPSTIGKNWSEFCDLLGDDYHTSFNYEMGHEGLGVCTSTKYGDGSYNVIGFFDGDSKRPSCVIVDFDGVFSEDEKEEQC